MKEQMSKIKRYVFNVNRELMEQSDFGIWVKYSDVMNLIEACANAASEWISVEDSLPEDGQRVLINLSDNSVDIDRYLAVENKFYVNCPVYSGCDVTHWQPLPKVPE